MGFNHQKRDTIYIYIFQLLAAAVSRRWQQFQRAQTRRRPELAELAELGAVGGAGCLEILQRCGDSLVELGTWDGWGPLQRSVEI